MNGEILIEVNIFDVRLCFVFSTYVWRYVAVAALQIKFSVVAFFFYGSFKGFDQ
jgi:hypothetical protein